LIPIPHGITEKENHKTLQKKKIIKRRDFLAGIASFPIIGSTLETQKETTESTASLPAEKSDPLRLGIVGFGKRGEERSSLGQA